MQIGNQIKKYRQKLNLSQEELADKIFVTRQTISNWENDKNYPDIKSISLLCNLFDVSLDQFIEGDVEEMKKIISEKEMKDFNSISIVFTIEMLTMLVSAYPLLKFLNIAGVIIWAIIFIITMITAIKIEKIKKEYDIRTYKEIVAFTEGKTLSKTEAIEEKAKRPYQQILLAIGCAIIAVIVMVLFEVIIG
ncbi:MAG: helix-turn-helix transcriptional regulator [Clostridia bacterium]|nr:helix-turn-helix transcriptional regulator [Clostridia bacterium]